MSSWLLRPSLAGSKRRSDTGCVGGGALGVTALKLGQLSIQTLQFGTAGHHVEHFLSADIFLPEGAETAATLEQGEASATG